MYQTLIGGLLLFGTVTLLTMVPGGPVETRSFRDLPRHVFWGFNVVLIAIGITSASAVALLVLELGVGLPLAATSAGLLIVIFALDLGGVFPRSPDKMEAPLLMLEVISLGISAVVLLLSFKGILIGL